ncbi:hypothetical protein BV898_12912 [Hypsibius exemplaris]|uniref:Uncharacterized protein n=1 Tax=Hypsibius exemplaris TaxID=2072580 RepID=A0A1W0WC38_HYPEX|nr:hypothetical protein BV898_12912 [Hypsibius exemplaris]
MLDKKSLSVYSKPFSPKPDKSKTNPDTSSTTLNSSQQAPSVKASARELTASPPIPAGTSSKLEADRVAQQQLPLQLPVKQADPRDFRKFTMTDAKARNLKLGQVNKILSPQRPADINAQIIEAARLKNAAHYVHIALQGRSRTPKAPSNRSPVLPAPATLKPVAKGVVTRPFVVPAVRYRSKSGACRVEKVEAKEGKKSTKPSVSKPAPVTVVKGGREAVISNANNRVMGDGNGGGSVKPLAPWK